MVEDNDDPEFAEEYFEYFDGNQNDFRCAVEVFMQSTDDFQKYNELYNNVNYYDLLLFHYLRKAFNLAEKKSRKRKEEKEKLKNK